MYVYPCLDKTIGIIWKQSLFEEFRRCLKCGTICHSKKDYFPKNPYQCKFCLSAVKKLKYNGINIQKTNKKYEGDIRHIVLNEIYFSVRKLSNQKRNELKRKIKNKHIEKMSVTHFKCSMCNQWKPFKERYIESRNRCLDCHRKYNREWATKHQYHKRESVKERMKEYSKKYSLQYIKNRCENDPLFKFSISIRGLILCSIKGKGYKKNSRTEEILGCDFETFKKHIERQFQKGMNWDNRNEWHIDHIYPVSLAKDEKHIIELNHYTNLRPMWAKENMSKGNKIIEHQTKLPI